MFYLVHRLWTHRSYKVKTPFKILLLVFFATAGQTSADPHDASRGFFFSHMGWLMMKKHPHVISEGSKIDMNDITDILGNLNCYYAS
ncbi:unnamed protein product [Leptidea sinapis]|uniref:Uncharacterized protein n=1 Tax=Leptidea sinapis TaxID=189913 RepID=A0A5E4PW95_9NEOP|nr:unnamed protein product [Leptidea sinapis]